MTGGTELWHDMPTSAMRSAPPSTASLYPSVLAEYV